MTSEVERLQAADPNFLIEIAVGPPCPALVPQNEPGLRFGGQYVTGITKQFIFKKAHLSNDDFRIFSKEGQLLCVSHHAGKNPYDALDPLGVGYQSNRPEWKSLTWVTGYHGMPSFKIRPKTVSRHGRQNVVDAQGSAVHFSVGNKSRLGTMSVRHNMEVNVGESGDTVYEVEADLAGRTLQFKNTRGELVAIATKSTKALVMSAALGSGSELEVDVAVGVDWTAILACLMAIQQVGAHLVKDVFSNFVATPLVGKAQDAALEATGLDGLAGKVGQLTNHGVSEFSKYSSMYNQFFK